MRRLVPAVGAVLVLGSLALFILLVVPDDETRLAPSGRAASDDNLPAPVVQADALRLLQRAAAAPTTASYTGTQFVSAWSSQGATSQVLEVTHTPVAGTTWRSGGHATTSGAVETASRTADPSILGGGAVTLLSSHYSLSTSGTSHVAGRAVDVVEARRPGAATGRPPVARFWLDHTTGLVLRREVYDGQGDPIRASAFIDVTVRTTTSSGSGAGSDATAASAWTSTMDGAAVSRMRTHGWDCPRSLPGPLPLVDARRGGEDKGIVHLSYADGIASISVFQQRGRLDGTKLRGYSREVIAGTAGSDDEEQVVWVRAEVPRRVVWSAGGKVYTVVADAPERTVDRAVVALHGAAGDGAGGTMDRLSRGLDRVGSWFNPFE